MHINQSCEVAAPMESSMGKRKLAFLSSSSMEYVFFSYLSNFVMISEKNIEELYRCVYEDINYLSIYNRVPPVILCLPVVVVCAWTVRISRRIIQVIALVLSSTSTLSPESLWGIRTDFLSRGESGGGSRG